MVLDPAKFRNRVWEWILFATVVLLAAAPRVALMLTAERRLDADESIVGLMAKHIAAGEGVPLFFYGQSYGGGHTIEALAASVWRFVEPGPAAAAVHAAPVVFSILTILIVFYLVRQRFGLKPALMAAVALSFSAPYLKSSLKADGYIETIFLGVLSLYCFRLAHRADIEGNGRRASRLSLLLGLLLGLAVWSYDFALIYAAAILFLGAGRVLRRPLRMLLVAAGAAVGSAPIVYANLTDDFAHFRHFTSAAPGAERSAESFFSSLWRMFAEWIPAFLTQDSIHNFVLPPPAYAWCMYGGLVFAAAVLISRRRETPGEFALVPALTIAASLALGYAGRSPRYLLPLEPFLSIGAALALYWCFRAKRLINHLAGILLAGALCVGIAGGVSEIFADDGIVEGNVKTDPESLVEVVDFLEENRVDCIYTTYFIKWRVLFLSDEKINAVDVRARERREAYLRYEEKGCDPGAPAAYVLHKDSPYRYSLAAQINRSATPYRVFQSSDHIAVVPALDEPDR